MNKLNEYYRKFVYKITDIFARKYEKGSDEYQIMAYRVFGWIDSIIKVAVFLLIAYYCGVFFITLPIYIAFVASKLGQWWSAFTQSYHLYPYYTKLFDWWSIFSPLDSRCCHHAVDSTCCMGILHGDICDFCTNG